MQQSKNYIAVDGEPSVRMPLPEHVSMTLTFDPIWPWKGSDLRKYLCQLWFRFVQWFRSYWVHKFLWSSL